jgi:hypothetical protein
MISRSGEMNSHRTFLPSMGLIVIWPTSDPLPGKTWLEVSRISCVMKLTNREPLLTIRNSDEVSG